MKAQEPNSASQIVVWMNVSIERTRSSPPAPAPSNGRLTSDAHFTLAIGGNERSTAYVTVKAEATRTNLQLADLVVDLQNALDTAGLGTFVKAGSVENRLTLTTDITNTLILQVGHFGRFILDANNDQLPDDGKYYEHDGGGIYRLEPTGLNRMLGSENLQRNDNLFGGTGLDFLYGNGGGGVKGDLLFTRYGTLFEAGENSLESDDAWKKYAKSTSNVWYVGSGYGLSSSKDTVTISYITTPNDPFFGHHVITIDGSPKFNWKQFTPSRWTPKTRNVTVRKHSPQTIPSTTPRVSPILTILRTDWFAGERRSARNCRPTLPQCHPHYCQLLTPNDDYQAIIIDTLDGNDTITVDKTVQKPVWIDAGKGDDVISIEPQQSFLPDKTDEFGRRNDLPANAYPFGNIGATVHFLGLTIDAKGDQADTDWYRFKLLDTPAPGDVIEIRPLSAPPVGEAPPLMEIQAFLPNLQPASQVITGNAFALNSLPSTPEKEYLVRVRSSKITDYTISFLLARTEDQSEPNDTRDEAKAVKNLNLVSGLTGLTFDTDSDVDWFNLEPDQFSLPNSSRLEVRSLNTERVVRVTLRNSRDEELQSATTDRHLPAIIELTNLDATKADFHPYHLKVESNGIGRYEIKTTIAQSFNGIGTFEKPWIIPDASRIQPYLEVLTHQDIDGPFGSNNTTSGDWYEFTLDGTSQQGQGIGIRPVTSGNKIVSNASNQLQALLYNADGTLLSRRVTTPSEPFAIFNLNGLKPATYRLRVIGLVEGVDGRPDFRFHDPSEYELYPTTFSSSQEIIDYTRSTSTPLGNRSNVPRRDVVLGGAGNDYIIGGSAARSGFLAALGMMLSAAGQIASPKISSLAAMETTPSSSFLIM